MPNQPPEPTPTSVTISADAEIAPAAVVAHLKRWARQMKISVSRDLSVADVSMQSLSVSALRRALGDPKSEEKIAMHGGGVRRREFWDDAGITTLRDEEDESVCWIIDPLVVEVTVAEKPLPNTEREFLKAFPSSKKGVGHSYVVLHSQWRLDLDFAPSKKRRGTESTIRHLSRVAIALKKEPNQAPEPTAPSGRGSS